MSNIPNPQDWDNIRIKAADLSGAVRDYLDVLLRAANDVDIPVIFLSNVMMLDTDIKRIQDLVEFNHKLQKDYYHVEKNG